MLKVLKITEDKVMLGDPKTKQLMTVNLVDCFEGIKIGDLVDVYGSENMVFVTQVEEHSSASQVETVVEKRHEQSKAPDVETAQAHIVQKTETEIRSHIEQPSNDESQTNEPVKRIKPEHKVRFVPLVFVMVLAVALSFFVGPYLDLQQPKPYLTSFAKVNEYLKQHTGSGVFVLEYDDLSFYEVPTDLKEAGMGDLFMIGEVKFIQYDSESTVIDVLIVCRFNSYDDIDFCEFSQKDGE